MFSGLERWKNNQIANQANLKLSERTIVVNWWLWPIFLDFINFQNFEENCDKMTHIL